MEMPSSPNASLGETLLGSGTPKKDLARGKEAAERWLLRSLPEATSGTGAGGLL